MGHRQARALRLIRRAAALVLLGAVVNVAVAWGCALLMIHPPSGNPLDPDLDYFMGLDVIERPQWYIMGWRRTGCLQIYSEKAGADELMLADSFRSMHSNGGIELPQWSRIHEPASQTGGLVEDARGWPFLTLRCEHRCSRFSSDADEVRLGLGLSPSNPGSGPFAWLSPRALPLRPIWSGFAINTVFYAAILWLLIVGPFALRGRRRIKRGLCPACAYPVGASDVCTECGVRCRSQQ